MIYYDVIKKIEYTVQMYLCNIALHAKLQEAHLQKKKLNNQQGFHLSNIFMNL